MKPSNKLLILLGLVLLFSPLIFISIYVRAHYEMGVTASDFNDNFVPLETKSPGMATVATRSFSRIVLNGDKSNIYLTYYFNQSNRYGVKIPEALKDVTKVDVDADGTLEITVDHKFERNAYSAIIIYAPASVGLTMNSFKNTALYANADSLSLVAVNSNSNIMANTNNRAAKVLNLLAKNSSLSLDFRSLDKLVIDGSNHSSISTIVGGTSDSASVERLFLKLDDNSRLDGTHISAKEIFGSIAENAVLEGVDRKAVKKM